MNRVREILTRALGRESEVSKNRRTLKILKKVAGLSKAGKLKEHRYSEELAKRFKSIHNL